MPILLSYAIINFDVTPSKYCRSVELKVNRLHYAIIKLKMCNLWLLGSVSITDLSCSKKKNKKIQSTGISGVFIHHYGNNVR